MSNDPRFANPRPRVRNSQLFRATEGLGNWAIVTLISSTTVQIRMAWRRSSRSISPVSGFRKARRFSEARLQAVSSRNMYSEHGLEALIRPSLGQVCHSLIVVSYCSPGSAQAHAARQRRSINARALTVFATARSVRRIRAHSPSVSTARRNSPLTRTELLAFCPPTVR